MNRPDDASIVVPCPACLARNRVPAARIADVPVCSDCRTRLLPLHPVELDGDRFDRYAAGASLPVLVDFWADWCGPCRVMAPEFAAATSDLAGRALLAKVDTERNRDLAARFAIQGIPTLVLLRGGREVARRSGALRRDAIVAFATGSG